MPKEWMIAPYRCVFPKPRGRSEQQEGRSAPILEQANQREFVIVPNQFRVERIQLISHKMMKGNARVLGGALNQPIQREPFLDFKLFAIHRHARPLGGGVGLVIGQSGLNGSGSLVGRSGGASGGSGIGSG